ncbi:MAG: hypothetical protein QOH35_5963 [Acidobacteriaceae bacterium]|nr:hypothetical protein [Acidobacteriaceae bacterium]
MLVIRDSQMKALSDAARSNFEKQLSDQLGASPDEVSKQVTAALAQGLTRESDVAQSVAQAMGGGQPNPPASTPAAAGPVFGKKAVGATTTPCPLQQQSHWIEIELLGEDDSPIPGEAYRIKLPDGSIVSGTLDAKGGARVENISEPGACQITFPALDRGAWEPIGSWPRGDGPCPFT